MVRLPLHGAALVVVVLTLIAAGQPLFTEDTWWHLSMGRAYAKAGPWLAADPVLFTAQGPPAPAAWLSSLALYGIERLFGFQGLRVAHVAAVAGILWLAWSLALRASGSRPFASVATSVFAAVSAYRLFQLRPELATIAAALILVQLISDRNPDVPRSRYRRRIAAAIALLGVWSNLHAGFLLGPILLAAALGSLLVERWVRGRPAEGQRERMRWLALALALGLAATFANPTGAASHGLYFSAGGATPELGVVADEWRPFDLFAWPLANLPPSRFSWGICWILLPLFVATVASGFASLVRDRAEPGDTQHHRGDPRQRRIDPALLGIGAVSFIAILAAVRFSWMLVFPLLAIGDCARARGAFAKSPRGLHVVVSSLACIAIVGGFGVWGAWPMISKAVRFDRYAQPYTTAKNDAHAVWFLRDAGLEGRLFNDYWSGNFLGYWLAPGLRTFINGSLNVPRNVMDASFLIERRAWGSEERFEDILDRYGIDVFFATGLPRESLPNRPVIATTTHLEDTPGWMLIFRSLSSAVYLRIDERNRDNLARVSAYYERARVPFDASGRGFVVESVVRRAPAWAIAHGLIPLDLAQLETRARGLDPTWRNIASERLAGLFACIGAYESAAKLDLATLRTRPGDVRAARRLVWTLLHLHRDAEATQAAERLARISSPQDEISRMLIESVRHLPALSSGQRQALVCSLPMMSRAQARQLGIGIVDPEVRSDPAR